jgi:hypothetical protein
MGGIAAVESVFANLRHNNRLDSFNLHMQRKGAEKL